MKNNITLSLIISLLALSKLFSFAKLNNFEEIHNNITSITTACEAQDAPSIFVLEALFANPENPYPVELWQNRDNEQINIFDIAREIKSIASLKEKIFNNADDAKRTHLFERLAQMEDIADRALIMEADRWKPHYVNELMKHIIGIRHAGISDLLPKFVDPSNCKDKELETDENQSNLKNGNVINPCDETGQHWSSLAQLGKLSDSGTSIANYMQDQGTDIQLIKSWWGSQINDSWDFGNRAVKVFYSKQRTLDTETYYWAQGGHEAAENEYTEFWENGAFSDKNQCYPRTTNQEESYIKAFTIWHAYVQEVLSKVKFPYNDLKDQKVCLIRTAGIQSFKSNNITHFGTDYTMPSASYDSFSLTSIYRGGDAPIINSLVPHHRIIHLYPLITTETLKYTHTTESIKNFKKDVVFLKNYYDENGILTIKKTDPSSVQTFVEENIYERYINRRQEPFEHHLPTDEIMGWDFYRYKDEGLRQLASLPEQITENLDETLLDILMREQQKEEDASLNGSYQETEFIVLSGPDLPFDYYDNNNAVSNLEKRLANGEGACGFWPNIKDLKQISNLGGSTGDLLYQDLKTGRKFILKRGASEGHIREEAFADLIYSISGHTITESRLYETPEGPVKIATYLENAKSLYDAYYNADETEQQRLRKALSEGFVIDALLANFDVIGLNMDNVLVGSDGQVYRVNTGASFRYQAMGKLKNDTPDESRKCWNSSPMTLWTLRDSKKKPNSALIFADISIYEVAEKILSLTRHTSTEDIFIYHYILDMDPKIQMQTQARFSNFYKVAIKALKMKAQGISPQEADVKLREWAEAEDWGPAFE